MPPLSNPLMGITAQGSQAAQLLAAGFPTGFSGFANSTAPFIPFNLMTSSVNTTTAYRLSPPLSSSTTTIFDLDQQPPNSIQHNMSRLNKNEHPIDESAPKASDTPPSLQLMDFNSGRDVENGGGSLSNNELTSNGILNSEHKRQYELIDGECRPELFEFSTTAHIPVESRVEMIGNSPICQICQSGPSNGLHFGAPRTCAACAAFFRLEIGGGICDTSSTIQDLASSFRLYQMK